MITCDENGNVIVREGESSFNLSSSDEYAELVLLLTSPDKGVKVDAALFAVDENLSSGEKARADRYAAFLSDYAARRAAKFEADESIAAEQRDAAISAFIERLQAKA